MKKKVKASTITLIIFILGVLALIAQILALCGLVPNVSGNIIGLITVVIILFSMINLYFKQKTENK